MSEKAVDKFHREHLADETRWPNFHVPLSGRNVIQVEYLNFPEDEAIEYRFVDSTEREDLTLAESSGHGWLPGFRWSEVLRLAENASHVSGNPLMEHICLLLLYPAYQLAEGDSPEQVKARLERAFAGLDLARGNKLKRLSSALVPEEPLTRWRHQEPFGWINDDTDCLRNPTHPRRATDHIQFFSSLRSIFEGCGAS